MTRDIINDAFGRLDTIPREIRDEIYKFSMLDNTMSVRHAGISNTNGRIRQAPVINGLPALASASKSIRNEILSDIDITTIHRHKMHIIFNLGKRMPTTNLPPDMRVWTAATIIDVTVTVRTIPGEQYSKREAKNLPKRFSKRVISSFPRTDKTVSRNRRSVDLRYHEKTSQEALPKKAKLPASLRLQLPAFYHNC